MLDEDATACLVSANQTTIVVQVDSPNEYSFMGKRMHEDPYDLASIHPLQKIFVIEYTGKRYIK